MNVRMKAVTIFICMVMLFGIVPISATAESARLSTPSNIWADGTTLKWDAVSGADYYAVWMYDKNITTVMAYWKTEEASLTLQTYPFADGGSVFKVCAYDKEDPIRVSQTGVSSVITLPNKEANGKSINVHTVNANSSHKKAYWGQTVTLMAKQAPEGMVFERWELTGAEYDVGCKETDQQIRVLASHGTDVTARAVFVPTAEAPGICTLQPKGATLYVGETLTVRFTMDKYKRNGMELQQENESGEFVRIGMANYGSATIPASNEAATHTYRIVCYHDNGAIYTDDFTVTWIDTEAEAYFTLQPEGGKAYKFYTVTYGTNFIPQSVELQRYNKETKQWQTTPASGIMRDYVGIAQSSDEEETVSYRLMAITMDRTHIYSRAFQIEWKNTPIGHFSIEPAGGMSELNVGFDIELEVGGIGVWWIDIEQYKPETDEWWSYLSCGKTNDRVQRIRTELHAENSPTEKLFRLVLNSTGGISQKICGEPFLVQFSTTEPLHTITLHANDGTGETLVYENYYGDFMIPNCMFDGPQGMVLDYWAEDSPEGKAAPLGEPIPITRNRDFYAVWKTETFSVAFDPVDGVGEMETIYDVLGQYVLPECEFEAKGNKRFKYWEVNGEAKKPGETVMVTQYILVRAVWEDIEPEPHICSKKLYARREAKCTKDGKLQYTYCVECQKYFEVGGAEITDIETWGILSATGHMDADGNNVCDTCNEQLTEDDIVWIVPVAVAVVVIAGAVWWMLRKKNTK